MKHKLVMLINQRAAFRKKRQAMHSDARSKALFLVWLCFALPCLSKQKIPSSVKMQMLQGTRTSSKREQWLQASGGADTAFEPPRGIDVQLINNQLIPP